MTALEIQTILDDLYSAYRAAIAGKMYSITVAGNTRMYTRQDLKLLQSQISFWALELEKVQTGRSGPRVKFITPR